MEKVENASMSSKKLCWVTPDCFADCDFDIVPALCNKGWRIQWIIVFNKTNNRYKEEDFYSIKEKTASNLSIEFVYFSHRLRYPQNIFDYIRLARRVHGCDANLNYINYAPNSPWSLAFFLTLPKHNTIITAHQGYVHEGMGHYKYNNYLRDRVYGRLRNVNMFSKSQALLFQKRYKNSRIFQFPLGLKHFGDPTCSSINDGIVRFLAFGTINYAKHIDLLLDAACNLYKKGFKNISVRIAGQCEDWETIYGAHVKYPEIFKLDIRLIDNSEIPNLFSSSDFFVQPYRVISQSGPFKIAMNYNLPMITSNLPGFTDEMVEETTGYTFETGNVLSLEDAMIKAIMVKMDGDSYNSLKARMKAYVDNNYSKMALVRQYEDMFNEISKKYELAN